MQSRALVLRCSFLGGALPPLQFAAVQDGFACFGVDEAEGGFALFQLPEVELDGGVGVPLRDGADRPATGGILTPLPLCGFRRESRHRGISVEKIDEVGVKSRSHAKYTRSSPRKRLHSPPTMRYNNSIKHHQRRDMLWQTYRCNSNIAKKQKGIPFCRWLTPNDNG